MSYEGLVAIGAHSPSALRPCSRRALILPEGGRRKPLLREPATATICEVPDVGITVHWSRLGLGSIIGFLVGWFIFGLFAAVVLAIVVMLLMGVIKVS